MVHLLIQGLLPFQAGIEIVGLVRALFGPQEAHLQNMPQHLFQRLAVLFVHGHKERREHHEDHADRRGAGVELCFQQEKQRYANHTGDSKADKLPLGQIQNHLRFYCVHVFGYSYISQIIT